MFCMTYCGVYDCLVSLISDRFVLFLFIFLFLCFFALQHAMPQVIQCFNSLGQNKHMIMLASNCSHQAVECN